MAKKAKIRVKMLTAMAGAERSLAHGAVTEVEAHVAEEWVAAGICALVPDDESVRAERDGLAHTVKQLEAENARLRAEIDRLVKAAGKPKKGGKAGDADPAASETLPVEDPTPAA